ncbi:UNVERIFIED_CONTAM: Premnaspirodiene oxygenase [Sesamum radiatum]|uniref:Premnaspirodiene oxygenase n=1 Tax=Sesamum radiatum TaxID=300843 RepID=A0AAW2LRV0_SESRA
MELEIPSFLIISLIFIVPLLNLINRLCTSRRNSRPKLPPGPWKLPLIGSLHHLSGASLPHYALRNLARKYGPIMHLQLGEIPAVVISTPRVAKELFTTHDLAFSSRARLQSLAIMTYNYQDIGWAPYGDYWKQMRKICFSELLSSKNVRSFSTIREEEAANLVESIRSHVISNRLDSEVKFLQTLTGLRTKLMKLHDKIDQVLNVIIDEHMEKLQRGIPGEEDLVDVLLRFKQKGSTEFVVTMDNIKAITLVSQ